jgi:hypothetical protein
VIVQILSGVPFSWWGVPHVKDLFEQIAARGGPGWKSLLDRWDEAEALLQRGISGELQKVLDECRGAINES